MLYIISNSSLSSTYSEWLPAAQICTAWIPGTYGVNSKGIIGILCIHSSHCDIVRTYVAGTVQLKCSKRMRSPINQLKRSGSSHFACPLSSHLKFHRPVKTLSAPLNANAALPICHTWSLLRYDPVVVNRQAPLPLPQFSPALPPLQILSHAQPSRQLVETCGWNFSFFPGFNLKRNFVKLWCLRYPSFAMIRIHVCTVHIVCTACIEEICLLLYVTKNHPSVVWSCEWHYPAI